MYVFIFDQDDFFVGQKSLHPISTRSHRSVVQVLISFDHGCLGKEGIDFSGYGRKKRHGQPVEELRVFCFESDLIGVTVNDLGTRKIKAVQVQPDAFGLFPVEARPFAV